MIDEIRLHDVALIHEATMWPSRGLTVLTGETGSGKTAFLSGLKLLVGERGAADMVREGAGYLEVEGRFFTAGGAEPDGEDEGTVVSRSITADGRTRVRINGSMASVRDLSATVGATVDLCGQHEHQRLTKLPMQAAMVDAWIGCALDAPLAAYREALAQAAEMARLHRELQDMGKADGARLDEARFIVRRVEDVGVKPGEYEELLDQAKRMENLEDLVRATAGAHEALAGDGGAIDAVNDAAAALDMGSAFDRRLAEKAQALREACYVLQDVSRDVDALMPDADAYDADQLEYIQQRIASYQGLMRSFGPTVDDVMARESEARAALAMVEDHDALMAESLRRVQKAEAALEEAAEALSAVRAGCIPAFEQAVNELLAQLEMPGCALSCEMERLPRERWGENGPDQLEFLFRPGRDLEPRPLNRIASGGEMSRVVLAVKAVLGEADEVETLVFDEVDAGVGGKTALAVGAVLKRLARTHQVIVVTHLAQIAVLGDVHYVVERTGRNSSETHMREVEGESRVTEIARMLSGTVDAASFAHATRLLSEA